MLRGAKTCELSDGSIVDVRAPLRENETSVARPYWLVDDIEKAVFTVKKQCADIASPASRNSK